MTESTTPDTYPKPTEQQVAARMAEVRAALDDARQRFNEHDRARKATQR